MVYLSRYYTERVHIREVEDITYKVTDQLVVRSIGGEYVAVPVGETSKTLNGVIALTPSGEILLKKLQQGCEYEDLVQALLDKYEVDREQAETDINRFLEKLKGLGLL